MNRQSVDKMALSFTHHILNSEKQNIKLLHHTFLKSQSRNYLLQTFLSTFLSLLSHVFFSKDSFTCLFHIYWPPTYS